MSIVIFLVKIDDSPQCIYRPRGPPQNSPQSQPNRSDKSHPNTASMEWVEGMYSVIVDIIDLRIKRIDSKISDHSIHKLIPQQRDQDYPVFLVT